MSRSYSCAVLLPILVVLCYCCVVVFASSPVTISWFNSSSLSAVPAHSLAPGCIRPATVSSASPFGLAGGSSAAFDVWLGSLSSSSESNSEPLLTWSSVGSSSVLSSLPPLVYTAALSQSNGAQAVFGGFEAGAYTNTVVWSADEWQTVQTYAAPFCSRASFGYAVLPENSGVLIVAGGGPTSCTRNDVWVGVGLEAGADAWQRVNSSSPFPYGLIWPAAIAYTDLTVSSTVVLVSGGATGRLFNSVWISVNVGSTWQLVTSAAPWRVRYGHVMLADTSNNVYVAFGRGGPSIYNDYQLFNDIWWSNTVGVGWYQLKANGLMPGVYNPCSVLLNQRFIVVYGGVSSVTGYYNSSGAWSGAFIGQLDVSTPSHATVASPCFSVLLLLFLHLILS